MADISLAGDRLKSFIERIERPEEEKAALATDIREVYNEAKGVGFDAKTMRQVIKRRKLDRSIAAEQDALMAAYLSALGMKEGE